MAGSPEFRLETIVFSFGQKLPLRDLFPSSPPETESIRPIVVGTETVIGDVKMGRLPAHGVMEKGIPVLVLPNQGDAPLILTMSMIDTIADRMITPTISINQPGHEEPLVMEGVGRKLGTSGLTRYETWRTIGEEDAGPIVINPLQYKEFLAGTTLSFKNQ